MQSKSISRGAVLLLVIITVAFWGCRSYKDLGEAPKTDTNGLIRDSLASNGDTTTIANVPWKEYFKDSKLQALIQEGLNKNLDMQITLSRVSQAEISLSTLRAANLPTLGAGVSYSNTMISAGKEGTKVLGYSTQSFSLGFTATWEADLWGKLSYQARSGYANYLNSVEYKNLIQTNLVANIAIAYYNLLALDQQMKITGRTIGLLQQSAETMQQLKESGQQNQAAVEQSKALLYSTQLSAVTLQRQIRVQENTISQLLGRVPGPIDRDTLGSEMVADKLAYGVPAQFLAKRPDVKQAEFIFLSAYNLTNVAKANLYPSFTIGSASSPATLGVAGGLADLFKPDHVAAQLVASLTQPVFYRKQLRNNVKIAQAQQDQALLSFKSTVLNAGAEVSNIIYSYNVAVSKDTLRAKQVESMNKAVEFTQDLLIAGEATYIEVLTAEQNLLSAQLSQVNDKLEQLTYSVSLYKALGGGSK
ncbi:MAG TPA: efflux transporter outer membrane subunit [Bacteroidales bacterium]